MRYQTHVISSVAAAVLCNQVGDLPLSIGILGGVAVGSLLPDIDEPGSYIGRRARGLSDVTKRVFGHRGFTHSLLAVLLVFIPAMLTANPNWIGIEASWLNRVFYPIFFGLGLGYLFHILGDMFSKAGVPLFLPFSKIKIKVYLYKTGGTREMIIRYGCVLGILYMLATGNVLPELMKW